MSFVITAFYECMKYSSVHKYVENYDMYCNGEILNQNR